MKKAVIIGATSGIGKALAEYLSNNGYTLGITGRRIEILDEMKKSLPGDVFIKQMDVNKYEAAMKQLLELVEEMGGMDIIIISSGLGGFNKEYEWEIEETLISTNVTGFAAITNAAAHYFIEQGYGHIVGLSSVASVRGNLIAPGYGASKAFVSIYLEGVRQLVSKRSDGNIFVTDILPGYIDTPMTKGQKGMFWVVQADKAAKCIMKAVQKRKKKAYVPPKWRIMAFFYKRLPDFLAIKYSP